MAKKAPESSVAKKTKPKSTKSSSRGASIETPLTKTELFNTLAEIVNLTKKQIKDLFGSLEDIIAAHLKKNGPQQFTLPGIAKIVVKHKPAIKARKGKNPFTGEEMMFKAKPARSVVKIRPLGKLKAMV